EERPYTATLRTLRVRTGVERQRRPRLPHGGAAAHARFGQRTQRPAVRPGTVRKRLIEALLRSGSLELDLDLDAGGHFEALKAVDGLGGVLHDVEQALVDPHLEVLAAVLVLVGG